MGNNKDSCNIYDESTTSKLCGNFIFIIPILIIFIINMKLQKFSMIKWFNTKHKENILIKIKNERFFSVLVDETQDGQDVFPILLE